MIQAGQTERWVVIGDLHLDPGTPGDGLRAPDNADVAFRSFAESLADDVDGATSHLVLLGDIVDFDRLRASGVSETAAEAAVERLRASHPLIVDALRRVGRAGFRLHLVAGNHDPEWTLPGVADRMGQVLGEDLPLEVHPWMLRVAGRVHAEHGNHFHDLNAMPRPSQPLARNGPGLHLGAVIDQWSRESARSRAPSPSGVSGSRGMRALGVAAAFIRLARRASGRIVALAGPRERARRQRYRTEELWRDAAKMGIRPETAAALDHVGQIRPLRIVRRLVESLRHAGPETRGQLLMRRGAQRLEDLLERFGEATPVVVLAHSHIAELTTLRRGRSYANPGRWAADLEGAYPYVEVRWDGESITTGLFAWDDAIGESRSVSERRSALVSAAAS